METTGKTKRCSGCKEERPLELFTHWNAWYCKDCLNKRQRDWRHWKRAEYLAAHPPVPKVAKESKKCAMCGEEKPIKDFNFLSKEQGKRSSYCNPCQRDRAISDRERRGREDEYLLYRCTRRGTTPEWYQERLQKQNGVCALCLEPETHPIVKGGSIRSLAIDHDHATGRLRGLLCFRCNTSIRQLDKHGHAWIERVTEYLKE